MPDLHRGRVPENPDHPGKRQPRVLVRWALQMHGGGVPAFFEDVARINPAVKDRIGGAGPFRIARPSLRRRPDLAAPVVLPARVKIVLLRPIDPASVARIDVKKVQSADAQLNDAAADFRHDQQLQNSIGQPHHRPAQIVFLRNPARGAGGRQVSNRTHRLPSH